MSCSQPVGVFQCFPLGVVFAAVTACAFGRPSHSKTTQTVSDPLPGWNEGPAKRTITDFVTRVTAVGSQEFVSASERIATFDLVSMKEDWKTIYPPAGSERAATP